MAREAVVLASEGDTKAPLAEHDPGHYLGVDSGCSSCIRHEPPS